ncbi:hypothetical protein [Lentibacillus amyloliquefaciens]|uniref:Uncharacterized protein n=1 Tax=Lentibacillus amyloliquefaciens TaxID=1472767 RepID=A0A0U3NRJ7_9BACI|nr:hypothetical protein [Lentibacillus amyloliquefaciens]ALX49275.1 hypothetical protein AOX59_12160 [Lentibacillus amyloliquefaciens]
MELKLRNKMNGKRGLYVFPLLVTVLLFVNFYMIINHKSIVTTTIAMISAALLIILFFMSIWSIVKQTIR